jgi:hypothetical protein
MKLIRSSAQDPHEHERNKQEGEQSAAEKQDQQGEQIGYGDDHDMKSFLT